MDSDTTSDASDQPPSGQPRGLGGVARFLLAARKVRSFRNATEQHRRAVVKAKMIISAVNPTPYLLGNYDFSQKLKIYQSKNGEQQRST